MKKYKLYELPEYKDTKLYIDDKVIIFDHLDGLYSYCYLLEDKSKLIHINACTDFVEYKDGYRLYDEALGGSDGNNSSI